MMKKFRLKKGDNVTVITGKDKGKTGEIIEVLKNVDKVKVRGVNIVKKHKNERRHNYNGRFLPTRLLRIS